MASTSRLPLPSRSTRDEPPAQTTRPIQSTTSSPGADRTLSLDALLQKGWMDEEDGSLSYVDDDEGLMDMQEPTMFRMAEDHTMDLGLPVSLVKEAAAPIRRQSLANLPLPSASTATTTSLFTSPELSRRLSATLAPTPFVQAAAIEQQVTLIAHEEVQVADNNKDLPAILEADEASSSFLPVIIATLAQPNRPQATAAAVRPLASVAGPPQPSQQPQPAPRTRPPSVVGGPGAAAVGAGGGGGGGKTAIMPSSTSSVKVAKLATVTAGGGASKPREPTASNSQKATPAAVPVPTRSAASVLAPAPRKVAPAAVAASSGPASSKPQQPQQLGRSLSSSTAEKAMEKEREKVMAQASSPPRRALTREEKGKGRAVSPPPAMAPPKAAQPTAVTLTTTTTTTTTTTNVMERKRSKDDMFARLSCGSASSFRLTEGSFNLIAPSIGGSGSQSHSQYSQSQSFSDLSSTDLNNWAKKEGKKGMMSTPAHFGGRKVLGGLGGAGAGEGRRFTDLLVLEKEKEQTTSAAESTSAAPLPIRAAMAPPSSSLPAPAPKAAQAAKEALPVPPQLQPAKRRASRAFAAPAAGAGVGQKEKEESVQRVKKPKLASEQEQVAPVRPASMQQQQVQRPAQPVQKTSNSAAAPPKSSSVPVQQHPMAQSLTGKELPPPRRASVVGAPIASLAPVAAPQTKEPAPVPPVAQKEAPSNPNPPVEPKKKHLIKLAVIPREFAFSSSDGQKKEERERIRAEREARRVAAELEKEKARQGGGGWKAVVRKEEEEREAKRARLVQPPRPEERREEEDHAPLPLNKEGLERLNESFAMMDDQQPILAGLYQHGTGLKRKVEDYLVGCVVEGNSGPAEEERNIVVALPKRARVETVASRPLPSASTSAPVVAVAAPPPSHATAVAHKPAARPEPKPFQFGETVAQRKARELALQAGQQQNGSPIFTDRLGSWKAREAEAGLRAQGVATKPGRRKPLPLASSVRTNGGPRPSTVVAGRKEDRVKVELEAGAWVAVQRQREEEKGRQMRDEKAKMQENDRARLKALRDSLARVQR